MQATPKATDPCAQSEKRLGVKTFLVDNALYCADSENRLLAFTVENHTSVVVEDLGQWQKESVRLLAVWAGPKRECAEGGADLVRISVNRVFPQACAWACGKWLACADGLFVLRTNPTAFYHQQILDNHLADALSKKTSLMRGSP